MKNPLLFVGLDVHAQNITIALALAGEAEARFYGTIAHDLHALEKVFAKMRHAHPETGLQRLVRCFRSQWKRCREGYSIGPSLKLSAPLR